MVLDGAVDPEATPHTSEIDQTMGFQRALTAYLKYCVGSGNCPLGDTVAGAQRRLIQLFEQIDAHPLPTTDGRKLTQGLAFFGFDPAALQPHLADETQALRAGARGQRRRLAAARGSVHRSQPGRHYTGNASRCSRPSTASTTRSTRAWPRSRPAGQRSSKRRRFSARWRCGSPTGAPTGRCGRTLPKPDYCGPGRRPDRGRGDDTRPRDAVRAGGQARERAGQRGTAQPRTATVTPPTRAATSASTRPSTPTSSRARPPAKGTMC